MRARAEHPRRAGVLRRLAAFAIDIPFVLAVLGAEVILAAVGFAIASIFLPLQSDLAELLAVALGVGLLFVGPLPYFSGLESSAMEATIGKRLLGIRVVGENGQRIAPRQATARFMLKWLALYPSGAGFLAALVRPDHLSFHDSVSRTRVVRR